MSKNYRGSKHMNKQTPEWEKEFDEIGFGNQAMIPGGKYGAKRVELKKFISQIRQEAHADAQSDILDTLEETFEHIRQEAVEEERKRIKEIIDMEYHRIMFVNYPSSNRRRTKNIKEIDMNKTVLSEDLIEKLADIEHQRWSDWQKYLHKVYEDRKLDEFIPRWERQIKTPYSELSEEEKQSDRDQVERYLPIIKQLLASTCEQAERNGAEEILSQLPLLANEFEGEVGLGVPNFSLVNQFVEKVIKSLTPRKEVCQKQ